MFKSHFKPDPDDFVIIVLGPTGSGKSNFINTFTGNVEQRKASNLKSDTQGITPYPISYQGLRVVLVDTPGFDDTYRPDIEILRIIADWLKQKYSSGTPLKITGIIYFHRITDNRMSGSACKILQTFSRLCGNAPLPRTRLVTTMWDQAKDQDVAKQRETQLKHDFWKALIDGGAITHKFDNTPNSARDIVGGLLSMGNDGEELLLQEELVAQQKRLNETEAGKVLYNQFQKLLADQRRMIKGLVEEARLRDDPVLTKSLQDEYDKINAQLQKTYEDLKEMKVPLSRRILLWLATRNCMKGTGLDYAQV